MKFSMKILTDKQLLNCLEKDRKARANMTDKGGGIALSFWRSYWNSWISEELGYKVNFTLSQIDKLFNKAHKLKDKV